MLLRRAGGRRAPAGVRRRRGGAAVRRRGGGWGGGGAAWWWVRSQRWVGRRTGGVVARPPPLESFNNNNNNNNCMRRSRQQLLLHSEGRHSEGRRYFTGVLRMPAAPPSTWARDSLSQSRHLASVCESYSMDVRSGVVRGGESGFCVIHAGNYNTGKFAVRDKLPKDIPSQTSHRGGWCARGG